jgi:hypothetical protein
MVDVALNAAETVKTHETLIEGHTSEIAILNRKLGDDVNAALGDMATKIDDLERRNRPIPTPKGPVDRLG